MPINISCTKSLCEEEEEEEKSPSEHVLAGVMLEEAVLAPLPWQHEEEARALANHQMFSIVGA